MKNENDFKNNIAYIQEAGRLAARRENRKIVLVSTFKLILKIIAVFILICVIGGLITWAVTSYEDYQDQARIQTTLSNQSAQDNDPSYFYLEGDIDHKTAITVYFLKDKKTTLIKKDGKFSAYRDFHYKSLSGNGYLDSGNGEYSITYHYSKGGSLYMLEIDGLRYFLSMSTASEAKGVIDRYTKAHPKEIVSYDDFNEIARLTGVEEIK